ncbi:MAG: transposase [Pseudoramibacter sp. EUB1.1]|uniref:Transposase n=1 Tax=Candidatus Pseudoramibacter fermentans TaxID=2594427 RepID=A0A6L5GSX3_9FIRM|nr:transposase [Candidatus Pseudoramibacter fermentans]
MYELVEEKYSADQGRPSIDPVVLIKIPFIQYLYGIKSMRRPSKKSRSMLPIVVSWIKYARKVPHFSTLARTTRAD